MNLNCKGFILVIVIFLLSSCIKTSADKTLQILSKGKGEWNVDYMRVTTVSLGFPTVLSETEHYDVGVFTFKGKNATDGTSTMSFDGSVLLSEEFGQSHYFSFSETNANVSMGEIIIDQSGGLGGATYFEIIAISKNKLTLFTPRSLNAFYTNLYDFNFYFECSRK